ncbi:MAG: response regulator transcription factor [Oscillatoriaceae cyanobacterium]
MSLLLPTVYPVETVAVMVLAANPIIRSGLESIITAHPELEVVGVSTAPATALELIEQLGPDVVLVDAGFADGETLLSLVPEGTNKPRIVALVDDLEGGWIAEALRSGVRGILPRDAEAEEIIAAVLAAQAGLVVLHPEALEFLSRSSVATRSLKVAEKLPLTPREIEVLEMLAAGVGNKIIAKRLSISEHTVKFHISSIFTKLGASSRTEAVTLGARQGLIAL